MGDNQFGTELMGHSLNDRTRYSVALLSSNDGNVNLSSKNAYTTFITASQAFNAGYQGGVDRVGGYAVHRQWADLQPDLVRSTDHRSGQQALQSRRRIWLFYAKKLDFQLFYQHGWDSAYFGTSTPSNATSSIGRPGPVLEWRIRGRPITSSIRS